MNQRGTDLVYEIWAALREGPLSTTELAKKVGAHPSTVRRHVKRMETLWPKWVKSDEVPTGRRLFFFPTTGDILTETTHDRIEEIVGDLRAIARRQPVKPGVQLPGKVKNALRRDYRAYLGNLAGRADKKEKRQIKAFEGQLMAVMNGTDLSDVLAFFGVRPFIAKVKKWRILPAAPVSFPGYPVVEPPLAGDPIVGPPVVQPPRAR